MLLLFLLAFHRVVWFHLCIFDSFPGGSCGKESVCQCRRHKRHGFDPWVGKIPWKRKWQPTPVFLPGKFHGQRSLVGYNPWGHKDRPYWMTEHACIGTPIVLSRIISSEWDPQERMWKKKKTRWRRGDADETLVGKKANLMNRQRRGASEGDGGNIARKEG